MVKGKIQFFIIMKEILSFMIQLVGFELGFHTEKIKVVGQVNEMAAFMVYLLGQKFLFRSDVNYFRSDVK